MSVHCSVVGGALSRLGVLKSLVQILTLPFHRYSALKEFELGLDERWCEFNQKALFLYFLVTLHHFFYF
jgi:hypothetical protein